MCVQVKLLDIFVSAGVQMKFTIAIMLTAATSDRAAFQAWEGAFNGDHKRKQTNHLNGTPIGTGSGQMLSSCARVYFQFLASWREINN